MEIIEPLNGYEDSVTQYWYNKYNEAMDREILAMDLIKYAVKEFVPASILNDRDEAWLLKCEEFIRAI